MMLLAILNSGTLFMATTPEDRFHLGVDRGDYGKAIGLAWFIAIGAGAEFFVCNRTPN
jgi:hypothetical protein